MLKQSNFTYYLKTSFHSHHTVATSSGLRKMLNEINIYRIFTKDGTTEMGSRVYGFKGCAGAVWCDMGM